MTDQELERLDSLTKHNGWPIMVAELEKVGRDTLVKNTNVKNRDIVSPGMVIHESALEQIRENNGFLRGVKHMIDLAETAQDKRIKKK